MQAGGGDLIPRITRRRLTDDLDLSADSVDRPIDELANVSDVIAAFRDRRAEMSSAGQEPIRSLLPEVVAFSLHVGRRRTGVAQGKRIFFAWQPARVCPSNLTNVFAFGDDASIGLLSSAIHHEWARAQSSTLEDRFRYTPTSAFETFPWPTGDLTDVGELAHRLMAQRSETCLEREIGLTKLYNEVDDGAYRDLRELHEELDEAVAAAYGWPSSAAHDPQESNLLLLELNRAIAAGEIDYRPFE